MIRDILKNVRRLEISTQNKITSLFAGNYRSAFRGRGIEFSDIRPYDLNDDVRDIDWKTSSKQGEVFVKTYHESRDNTLFFLLDASEKMQFSSGKTPKYQILLEAFALLAFSAVQNGDRVGALIMGSGEEKIFPPKKGRKNILAILSSALERYENFDSTFKEQENTEEKTLKKTFLFLRNSSSIFWLSGDIPHLEKRPELQKIISLLTLKHDFIPLFFSDPVEENPSFSGNISVQDGFFGNISTISLTPQVLQEYKKIRNQKKVLLQKVLQKCRKEALFFSDSSEIFPALFRFFQMRERHFLRP